MLEVLEQEQIVAFQDHMADRMGESYRWDLWAVAYIIQGGCSDDSFDYFREWIIAQGRTFYEGVLAAPERAAEGVAAGDEDDPGSRECESMICAAGWAYESKTGQEIPPSQKPLSFNFEEPRGEPWDEDGVDQRYPELAARFCGPPGD